MAVRPEAEIRAELSRARAIHAKILQAGDKVGIAYWANKVLTLEWVLTENPPKSIYDRS